MASQKERKKPPEVPGFFVDRSVGDIQVPAGLRERGWILFPMYEVYGHIIAQNLDDPPWIEDAARNGLAILTADKKLRYVTAERETVEREKARVFCLHSGTLLASEMINCFENNRSRIERAWHKPGPYIYKVYENSIDQWWP